MINCHVNKAVCILCLLLLLSTQGSAQESNNDKAIRHFGYLEVFGNGMFISGNYSFESYLSANQKISFMPRAGLGVVPYDGFGISIPLEMTLGFGGHRCFETGFGFTFYFAENERSNLPFLRFGYRSVSLKKGVLFRIAFTPTFGGGFFPFFGLSIGKMVQ